MNANELFEQWVIAEKIGAWTGDEKQMCIAAMKFAKATGHAEGMKEAATLVNDRQYPMSSKIISKDAIAILAAIGRKEGMTE